MYVVPRAGDILTNIIINGVGINKVIIDLCYIKFTYWFINAELINIELPTGGVFISYYGYYLQ
jgi:hypothetical protein